MKGNIYLLQDNQTLVEMTEEACISEDLLQKLLAQYPSLLAGHQINSADPRRWLVIKRKKEKAGDESRAERWSLDHLFLDQDAVPTMVEVKRISEARMRRELVGQALDYAARIIDHWPIEAIRSQFEANQDNGTGGKEGFGTLFGGDMDQEDFWRKVKINMQAGRVRLIFVADDISPELRRMVEFLNAQMDPAEVLALELKQYIGQGHRMIVPNVIGQTIQAQQRKYSGVIRGPKTGEKRFVPAPVESKPQAGDTETVEALLEWAEGRGYEVELRDPPAATATLRSNDETVCEFVIDKKGILSVSLDTININQTRPFNEGPKRHELFDRLLAIHFEFKPKGMAGSGAPSIHISELSGEENIARFTQTLDWIAKEILDHEKTVFLNPGNKDAGISDIDAALSLDMDAVVFT